MKFYGQQKLERSNPNRLLLGSVDNKTTRTAKEEEDRERKKKERNLSAEKGQARLRADQQKSFDSLEKTISVESDKSSSSSSIEHEDKEWTGGQGTGGRYHHQLQRNTKKYPNFVSYGIRKNTHFRTLAGLNNMLLIDLGIESQGKFL